MPREVETAFRMPFGSLRKGGASHGIKPKVLDVKITTMDAELEFKIEVRYLVASE